MFNLITKSSTKRVSTFKINSVWGKVNKQIKELHEGTVELRDIPERINQILAQYANPEKIEKKTKKYKGN